MLEQIERTFIPRACGREIVYCGHYVLDELAAVRQIEPGDTVTLRTRSIEVLVRVDATGPDGAIEGTIAGFAALLARRHGELCVGAHITVPERFVHACTFKN